MCSSLCFPLWGPFVSSVYFGFSEVSFGGLIYFAFIHQKKKKERANSDQLFTSNENQMKYSIYKKTIVIELQIKPLNHYS